MRVPGFSARFDTPALDYSGQEEIPRRNGQILLEFGRREAEPAGNAYYLALTGQ